MSERDLTCEAVASSKLSSEKSIPEGEKAEKTADQNDNSSSAPTSNVKMLVNTYPQNSIVVKVSTQNETALTPQADTSASSQSRITTVSSRKHVTAATLLGSSDVIDLTQSLEDARAVKPETDKSSSKNAKKANSQSSCSKPNVNNNSTRNTSFSPARKKDRQPKTICSAHFLQLSSDIDHIHSQLNDQGHFNTSIATRLALVDDKLDFIISLLAPERAVPRAHHSVAPSTSHFARSSTLHSLSENLSNLSNSVLHIKRQYERIHARSPTTSTENPSHHKKKRKSNTQKSPSSSSK